MRIKFTLPIQPFSVNRMHYRDKRYKTREYMDWELTVIQALNAKEPQQKLSEFRNFFSPEVHGLVVKFDYYFPANILINKKGLISSSAEDLSNIEKALLDILCLPKFFVQPYPSGVKNLNVDDKSVLKLISAKKVSPDSNFYVTMQISTVSLPKLPSA